MKVRELIKALLAYDMDEQVMVAGEDGEHTPVAHLALRELYDYRSHCCETMYEEEDAGICFCAKCGKQTVPMRTTFRTVEIQL